MELNRLFSLGLILLVLFQLNFELGQAHVTSGNENFYEADDHCTKPTLEINIAAVGPSSFDRDVIELPADTCITILFRNLVNIGHNFIIEYVEGPPEFHAVYMDLFNSSAVCGQATSDHADTPGLAKFNILTPKYYAEIEFYCGYEGHKEAGMKGIFKVLGEDPPDKTKVAVLIVAILLMLFVVAFFLHKRITRSFLK